MLKTNNEKWAPEWFKTNTHWACNQCIVGPKCTQSCYRARIYNPLCDKVCKKKQQISCAKDLVKRHMMMAHCPKIAAYTTKHNIK